MNAPAKLIMNVAHGHPAPSNGRRISLRNAVQSQDTAAEHPEQRGRPPMQRSRSQRIRIRIDRQFGMRVCDVVAVTVQTIIAGNHA